MKPQCDKGHTRGEVKTPNDTTSSLSRAGFPSTSISLLRLIREKAAGRREAMEELCRRYWKPVYSFIRSFRSCPREESKDLTQDFFVEVFEGRLVERYMPSSGSFRAFIRGCLRVFVLHYRRKAGAQKRGGDVRLVSMGDAEVDLLDQAAARKDSTPEAIFDRQWAGTILEQAMEGLRAELQGAKAVYLKVFERYGSVESAGEAPTYAALARELGLKETDVCNYLTWCRRRLRELILDRIRDYLTGEAEVTQEFVQLFSR